MEELNLEKLNLEEPKLEPKLENLGVDEVECRSLTVHDLTSGVYYHWPLSTDMDQGSHTALILRPEEPAQCTTPSSMRMRIRILSSRMPDYILVDMVIRWGPVVNRKKLRIFRPACMDELDWAGADFDLRTEFTLGEWQYSAHFVYPAISSGDVQQLTLAVGLSKRIRMPQGIVASKTTNGIEMMICRYQNGAFHGNCDACLWIENVVPLTRDELTAIMAGKESVGSVGVKEG